MINIMKKGLSVVMTLAIVLGAFMINASATTVSSSYDSDFAAIMSDNYYSSLTFGSDDNGLANYNIVSKGSSWGNMYGSSFNGRYNYINYSSGKAVEIVSKEGFVVPYGFTISWEIFTSSAETGTTELCVGDLRFVTNYGTKTLYLMYGTTELAKFETGCADASTFADQYAFNQFTVKYIDGVISVTRLITGKGDTTASNLPITWTLPDGTTSTTVPMSAEADFAYALVKWKSSSEIGRLGYFNVPAPFNSQYNGNVPTFSNVRFNKNNGFSTLQKFADFVDGLATNLNQADVTKARTIYDAIVANGTSGLVSEVEPLGVIIKAAELALLEGVTCDYDIKATNGGKIYCDGVLFENDKDNNPIDFGVKKTFTAVANSGYTFAYWANEDGDVVTTNNDITIVTNFKTVLTAVFIANKPADTVTVRFNDYTGNCVAEITTAANSAVTLPNMPFTYGYVFKGWLINGGIYEAGTEYSFTKDTIVTAYVAKASTTYKVKVTGSETEYNNTYTYNTKFTIKFNQNLLGDNEKFAGWYNGTNIVSYDEEYIFYVGADVAIEALIDNTGVAPQPIINVTDVSVVSDGTKASFLTERWMPEDVQYIESGAIYTKDLNSTGKLTVDGVNGTTIRRTMSKYNTARGQLRVNLGSKDGGSPFYLVGYLTYLSAEGEIITIYTPVYTATTTVAAN
ncbi:MAG: InlB B-repeat-containing protein [Clostridia bacterium]|nr:InlB B-repeat-containing protein [Clostridia bacterium]